ncbi:MAG: BamA/TamA family outer membrane protein [Bacteroidales bacterium]|nr:BamA/TamA family outer membrane protein [Candidatus Cryptobacteroides equifaecalis]
MRKDLAILTAAALFATSCSTTRVLPEGKYRLASNKVQFTEKSDLKSSDVTSYIRQKSNSSFLFGWNPFLYVYNWQNGSGKGMDKVWEKIGTAPVEFSQEAMINSEQNIYDHLKYLGYYDSEVKATIDTIRRTVKVKYIVTPGKRYPIDSLCFILPEGNDKFAEEFDADRKNIIIHKGDFLSEKILEAESSRSASYFNGLGYYDFNKNHFFFEADTLGGKALLKYQIRDYTRNQSAENAHPLNKYHFGDVSISHSSDIDFRTDVLKKLNSIKPGDIYNPKTVNNTYNRMSSLRLFKGVGVELTPRDSSLLDCRINLSESSISGIKADLELSSSSAGLLGISPQVNWYHKNIFKGGEWLSIGTKCNFQFVPKTDIKATEASLTASLSFPRFLGLSNSLFKGGDIPRTEISATFSLQDRPEYKRNMTSLSFGYNGSIRQKFFYQLFPLRGNYIRVFNLSEEFIESILLNPFLLAMFDEHIDLGVGGMLYYISNSDIVPKTSYSFAKLNLDVSGNLLHLFGATKVLGVDYSQYARGELSAGHVFRFGADNGQALAMRFVAGAGIAYGKSNVLPYDRQFYVGGASSMRGWQARTLGPGGAEMEKFFIIPSQTGDVKLEFDLEYRFKMFWKMEGALFAETGNIWDIRNYTGDFMFEDYENRTFYFHNFYKTLAADWGAGLRLNLDFILLRLDLGIKLRDPGKEEGMRWIAPKDWFNKDGFSVHFGVGYPF